MIYIYYNCGPIDIKKLTALAIISIVILLIWLIIKLFSKKKYPRESFFSILNVGVGGMLILFLNGVFIGMWILYYSINFIVTFL